MIWEYARTMDAINSSWYVFFFHPLLPPLFLSSPSSSFIHIVHANTFSFTESNAKREVASSKNQSFITCFGTVSFHWKFGNLYSLIDVTIVIFSCNLNHEISSWPGFMISPNFLFHGCVNFISWLGFSCNLFLLAVTQNDPKYWTEHLP